MTTTDLRTTHTTDLAAGARPAAIRRRDVAIATGISAGTRGLTTTVTAPTYRIFATAPCSTNAASLATNVWSPIEHKAMAKHDRWPLLSTS